MNKQEPHLASDLPRNQAQAGPEQVPTNAHGRNMETVEWQGPAQGAVSSVKRSTEWVTFLNGREGDILKVMAHAPTQLIKGNSLSPLVTKASPSIRYFRHIPSTVTRNRVILFCISFEAISIFNKYIYI